jgi:excisionase family DNA binding protein
MRRAAVAVTPVTLDTGDALDTPEMRARMLAAFEAMTSGARLGDKLTLTLTEAALLSGLARGHLRQAAGAGELRARIAGRGWRVGRCDLDEYVAELRRRRGRSRVRRCRRLHVRGGLLVDHAGRQIEGQIENVSMGGACVALGVRLPVGADVALDIPLPDGDLVLVRAEVIYSHADYTGLRFEWAGLDDPSRLLLHEALGA